MAHPAAAAGALALGAALVLGAATAPAVLLVAVLLVQGVLLSGGHRSLAVSGAVAGAVVAGGAAVAADVVVLLGEADRPLRGVPAVLALAVLAALVQQLVRRDGRPGLTASLAATVTLAALVVMAATFLASDAAEGGAPLVAAAAVAAALVERAVRLRPCRHPKWRRHRCKHLPRNPVPSLVAEPRQHLHPFAALSCEISRRARSSRGRTSSPSRSPRTRVT